MTAKPTRDSTREEFDAYFSEPVSAPRYVVRYRKREDARLTRMIVWGGKPPAYSADTALGPTYQFTDDEDGTTMFVSASLVEDVIIERGDRRGYYHQVGTWSHEEEAL